MHSQVPSSRPIHSGASMQLIVGSSADGSVHSYHCSVEPSMVWRLHGRTRGPRESERMRHRVRAARVSVADLVHLPARKGLAMLSSADSVILLQTAPDSTSAAALGLPRPSILPPSAKPAAAGSAAATTRNLNVVVITMASGNPPRGGAFPADDYSQENPVSK